MIIQQQKADFITTFALAFGKQVAMTDARASFKRQLPPLYPRSHVLLGWLRGTPYASVLFPRRWGVLFPSGNVVK